MYIHFVSFFLNHPLSCRKEKVNSEVKQTLIVYIVKNDCDQLSLNGCQKTNWYIKEKSSNCAYPFPLQYLFHMFSCLNLSALCQINRLGNYNEIQGFIYLNIFAMMSKQKTITMKKASRIFSCK